MILVLGESETLNCNCIKCSSSMVEILELILIHISFLVYIAVSKERNKYIIM